MEQIFLALGLIAAAFLTAVAALFLFAVTFKPKRSSLGESKKDDQSAISFLFEDDEIVDATDAARQIVNASTATGSDWARLVAALGPRFDGLKDLPWTTLEKGPTRLDANDGSSYISADFNRGAFRLDLIDTADAENAPNVDRHALTAMNDELAILRSTAEMVPYLNWRQNKFGEIIWANKSYLQLSEILSPEAGAASWPPPHLFEAEGPDLPYRAKIDLPETNGTRHFEIHSATLGDETLFTAIPVDDLVQAEASLSEFVNTLTGTFAHLPIGLAIFDHDRKLTLFNPALTDLTMLPVEFLCGQPSLFAFLDRLREKRIAPEPKNYKTWRQAMSELEENAINGTYLETWFLPTGQTYRITGRPHPGGAVAFLIEDVTSEMTLTHRFRAELEISQSILDGLEEAVAVFTPSGIMSLSNDAYSRLWDNDPSRSLTEISVTAATHIWGQKSNPTPVWQQFASFINEQGERKRWAAPVTLKDGRVLNCSFVPLVHGATLVSFNTAKSDPVDGLTDLVDTHLKEGLPA
ncbi:MAG TPA: diguanylate cyclase [Aliiroseovarius sp.]|nr:diguanylate cyclase [Aliiroseovarius sp.]